MLNEKWFEIYFLSGYGIRKTLQMFLPLSNFLIFIYLSKEVHSFMNFHIPYLSKGAFFSFTFVRTVLKYVHQFVVKIFSRHIIQSPYGIRLLYGHPLAAA